jgi:hypothetical protein
MGRATKEGSLRKRKRSQKKGRGITANRNPKESGRS